MKTLSLDGYEIALDESSGRILQIRAGAETLSLRGSLWRVDAGEQKERFTLFEMTSFSFEQTDKLKLFWHSEEMSVQVRLFVQDKLLKMDISVSCQTKALHRIYFPVFEGVEKISSDNDYLTIPFQNGFLIKNPVDTLLNTDAEVPFWMGRGGKKYENDYPAQYSYQYFSYYNPEKLGYYWACEDGNSYIKTIGQHYNADVDGMDLVFTNYPEGMGTVRYYALPYVYAFGFFHGDWQTATKIYRGWATHQKWCTLLKDRDISSRVKEIDFVRINHEHYDLGTRSEEYIQTCAMIQERLNCRPAMHWYGWNKAPKHGDWYPEMANFSNKVWKEELSQINKRLDSMGIIKLPYVNVHLWDSHLKSFEEEDARSMLVLPESRTLSDEPWSPDGNLYAACHASSKFKNKVLQLFDRLVRDEGFDGIYIDQVASFNATLCFEENHGHPVGGGNWWADEYHNMIGTFRKLMPQGKILTTESCCEAYHDLFDMFLILDTCSQDHGFHAVCGCDNVESLPLFAMIYNDSAVAYGSICKFENNDDQFAFNYIRNILWGMIPTAEGMEMEWIADAPEKWRVLKQGVAFFKENRDILLYGTLDAYYSYENETRDIIFGDFIKKCPSVICAVYSYQEETYAMLYNYAETAHRVAVQGKSLTVPAKSFLKRTINP